jgi:hypothetical protein
LWFDNLSHKLVLSEIKTLVGYKASRNVYITNDEEIKEGDFYFDSIDFILHRKSKYNDALVDGNKNAKKIILTTDYDLIEEGVQAVDNHFLKWFVNNQTYEYVEVEDVKTIPSLQLGRENGHLMYKIIIPTENPTTTVVREAMEMGDKEERDWSGISERFSKYDLEFGFKKEIKVINKETLEEAAEKYAKQFDYAEDSSPQLDFIEGSKWQVEISQKTVPFDAVDIEVFAIKPNEDGKLFAYIGYKITNGNFEFNVVPFTEPQTERMYSEEDLREAFKQSRQCKIFEKDMPPVYEEFEEWFEQFYKLKKK